MLSFRLSWLLAYNFIFHTVRCLQLPQAPAASALPQHTTPTPLSFPLSLYLSFPFFLSLPRQSVKLPHCLAAAGVVRSFRIFGNYAKAIIIIKRNVLKAAPSTPLAALPCPRCPSAHPVAVAALGNLWQLLIKFCGPHPQNFFFYLRFCLQRLLHNLPSNLPPSLVQPAVSYSGRNFIKLQNKN